MFVIHDSPESSSFQEFQFPILLLVVGSSASLTCSLGLYYFFPNLRYESDAQWRDSWPQLAILGYTRR